MEKNSIPFGLIAGLIIPFVAYAVLLSIYDGLDSYGMVSGSGFSENFRFRTSAIVALALNAIALNYYQKRRWTNGMRGVVIATTLYVVLWLYKFGGDVFQGY